MIKTIDNKVRYFDRNGREITDGCRVKYLDGRIEKIYYTNKWQLGTDATNPTWIKSGRVSECEYDIYPLTRQETEEVEVVE